MNVLWRESRGTVADVLAGLEPPPLAYSTVLTTLRTLEQKGYIAHEEDGRAYVYRPLIARRDAAKSAVDHVLGRFFGNSPGKLAVTLLGDAPLSEDEIATISRMIAQRKKGAK
ncbi:MAG: BlaI/MecI/CopY family transcriptional regulator [Candidatus Eremiobacteraeota bacterium]|nr:BlaI/MecI/CopY family transcriptional regulator [Candidatus Eremiobacteraeota bacterium]